MVLLVHAFTAKRYCQWEVNIDGYDLRDWKPVYDTAVKWRAFWDNGVGDPRAPARPTRVVAADGGSWWGAALLPGPEFDRARPCTRRSTPPDSPRPSGDPTSVDTRPAPVPRTSVRWRRAMPVGRKTRGGSVKSLPWRSGTSARRTPSCAGSRFARCTRTVNTQQSG